MIRTGFWKFGLLSWCLFSGFRLDFLKALENTGNSSSKGLFIDSCYDHCQTELQETWLFDGSPLLAKTVRSNFIFSISSSSIILSIILLSHFSSYSFLPFIVDFHFLLWSNSFHFFCMKNNSTDNCKGCWRLVLWPKALPKDRLPLPLQPHLPQPCYRFTRTPRTID